MHPQDETKTAFITDAGAYCYKVMSLGLKNVRATYQRLMDRIFEGLIGGDVEVYVDDIMVKSVTTTDQEISDHHQYEESIDNQGGAATEREDHSTFTFPILVNKDNRPHIQHSQKRRLVYLDNGERRSIFKTKGTASHPTILTKPTPEIPLLIYISVAEEAVSVAMVQERERKQHHVYFISKVLQDAKIRYQRIEKAALTLVITSQRLCPYFKRHSIIIRTDLPIKPILRKPNLVRQMVTWSVQLFEFGTSYESKGHVKAQALADFIRKMTA
ncbi:Retrovirus-related Pol polyprotein from transposon 17.6, partial [Mucuna pruriens]